MRPALGALALLLAVSLAAPHRAAALRWRVEATDVRSTTVPSATGGIRGRLASDGRGDVAYIARDGSTHVLRAGGRTRVLATPRCTYKMLDRLLVGGGSVLWQCSNPYQPEVIVFDLATAKRFVPRGLPLLADRMRGSEAMTYVVTGIGARWLSVVGRGYREADEAVVGLREPTIAGSWRTLDDTVILDASAPEGTVKLCDGLHRPPGMWEAGDLDVLELAYDPPYAIGPQPADDRTSRILPCPGAPPIRGSGGRLTSLTIGGGQISWRSPVRVHVASTRTGRSAILTPPGSPQDVVHTAGRVYVIVENGSGPDDVARLVSAPIAP